MAENKYIDKDLAVRKGQAFNLAILSACHQGKVNDNKFIAMEFLRFFDLANTFQKATIDQLEVALDNPEILKLLSKLDESINV